jgi:hypothetical protein
MAVAGFLFNASTKVLIRNGNKAKFWQHSWFDGEAPRNLASHLSQLVRRKNRTVQQELTNDHWIKILREESIQQHKLKISYPSGSVYRVYIYSRR